MQQFNKKLKKLFIILITSVLICLSYINNSYASVNKTDVERQLKTYSENIDTNNIQKEDVLKIYDEVTNKYTSEEIADIIEDNKDEIKKQGISEDVINTGENFIRTTDTEQLREIIEDNVDIDDIKNKIENGYTPNEILKSVMQEMPTDKKVEMATKVIWANKIVKTVAVILIIWIIYSTILRWIIYSKAGKHGWAAIIPIYRQIVMYKICGITPLFMILWFVPVFGLVIMFIMAIVKRFSLASSFGRSGFFGLGLLLFPPIFQTILALNPNIKYEGIEE